MYINRTLTELEFLEETDTSAVVATIENDGIDHNPIFQ